MTGRGRDWWQKRMMVKQGERAADWDGAATAAALPSPFSSHQLCYGSPSEALGLSCVEEEVQQTKRPGAGVQSPVQRSLRPRP